MTAHLTDRDRLAILAYHPKPRGDEFILLIVLTTFSCGKDGWRKAGDLAVTRRAHIDSAALATQRGQLAAAGLIDYRPGPGRGGSYRIKVPGVRGVP
jgi:hypothetical protein